MLFLKQVLSNLIIKETRGKVLTSLKINNALAIALREPYRENVVNQLFFLLGYTFKSSGKVAQSDIAVIDNFIRLFEDLKLTRDDLIFQFNSGKERCIGNNAKDLVIKENILFLKPLLQSLFFLAKYVIKNSQNNQDQRYKTLRSLYVGKGVFHHVVACYADNIALSIQIQNSLNIMGIDDVYDRELLSNHFKKLCQIYHPDKLGVSDSREFKIISKAYSFLKGTLESK
jgi:hypothetical protein